MRKPLLCLLTLAWAAVAAADGGFVAPYWNEIYESAQLAFLLHDAGQEDLHILPKFNGDARDFAWIVPTPAAPEVELSSEEIFLDLERLAMPVYRYRDEGWGCDDRYSPDYATGDGGGVEILTDHILGDYRVLVLGADDAAALGDSLTAWGFLHAENRAAIEPVLADYVDRGWSFTAVRIDPSLFEEGGWPAGMWYGALTPLRLRFASDEPVYPMKISAVSAATLSEVVLYAVSDRRLTFPGAETTYSNRITGDELSALIRRYPRAAAHLAAGDVITRLERLYAPEDMDVDLVLTADPDQSEMLRVVRSGFPATAALLLGLVAWVLARRRRRPA